MTGAAAGSMVLDHLVVGAASLEAGLLHLQDRLGILVPPGGSHPLMGTHNRLMRIGEGLFLEIIAIDPAAPPPGRRRWFALDDPVQRSRIAERPRLIAWVAGTRSLDSVLERAPVLGSAITATRGALSWRIGIRDDGALAEEAMLPVPIEWPDGPHPAERMEDLGIRLEEFRLGHPEPQRIGGLLAGIGARHLAELDEAPQPLLSARLRLPDGKIAELS
jgi:hypothetical protein